MGFRDIIKANNEARGHTDDPYAYLVVDEEHGIISFSAVRDSNGRDDTLSRSSLRGSQPLRGKDVEEEFHYVLTLLKTWGRGGIWVDLHHTPKKAV